MLRSWTLSIRSLLSQPTYTVAVCLSIALGVGASVAMFVLLDTLLLRSIKVASPEELVHISRLNKQNRSEPFPLEFVRALREEEIFRGVCGFETPYTAVELAGQVATRATHGVTGDCFATLGVRAAAGRLFGEEADQAGAERVAVLTFDTWQLLGGGANVLGSLVKVNDTTFTIVGVTEAGFGGLVLGFPPAVIFPSSQLTRSGGVAQTTWSTVFARRADDVAIGAIHERLKVIWPRLLAVSVPPGLSEARRSSYLDSDVRVTSAATGTDYMLRARFGRPVMALFVLGLIVLIVALVNVAHLVLSRFTARQGDFALRLALGANRRHLVADAAREAVLLVMVGGGAGIVFAIAANRGLVSLLALQYPGFALDTTPGTTAWLTVAAAAISSHLMFVLLPAARAGRLDTSALGATSHRLLGGSAAVRKTFIGAQVALTLILATVGFIAFDSLSTLRTTPLGIDVEQVLTAQLAPLPGAPPAPPDGRYYRDLLERLQSAPGVVAAALSKQSPLFSQPHLEATSAAAPQRETLAEQHSVSEGFLSALGIPLKAGRAFSAEDKASSPGVAIVSEALAERLFANEDAIGRAVRVGTGGDATSLTVVGVARDAVLLDLSRQNRLVVYRSIWQDPSSLRSSLEVLVRAPSAGRSATTQLREIVEQAGRHYPIYVRALAAQRDTALVQERLLSGLSISFASVGLMLAAIGVYGFLSHMVASTRREVGLRMALGATPREIAGHVLMAGLRFTVAGVVVGVPIAVFASQATERIVGAEQSLRGVAAVLLAAVVILSATALASLIPARRAMSCDPGQLLKNT